MRARKKGYAYTLGEFAIPLTKKQRRYSMVKSILDRIIALIALIILSPLFLAVCIAQKISSSQEPIFFVQKRVGKNGSCFNIIKFRTMKSSAPKNVASRDFEGVENYISKLGGFLRKTSIDELPQLINVLRGEMALIGYRPLVYTEREIRHLRKWYGIYQVLPGITGWAQVNGRDTVDVYDKVRYDREYLKNMSLTFDLKIVFLSLMVVIRRVGIVEGKTKAAAQEKQERAEDLEEI
jgi:O-antigen biosynthesis protein WbqP